MNTGQFLATAPPPAIPRAAGEEGRGRPPPAPARAAEALKWATRFFAERRHEMALSANANHFTKVARA